MKSKLIEVWLCFFGNSRIKFFLSSWLHCEQYGKINTKKAVECFKRTQSKVQCSNCYNNFHIILNFRDTFHAISTHFIHIFLARKPFFFTWVSSFLTYCQKFQWNFLRLNFYVFIFFNCLVRFSCNRMTLQLVMRIEKNLK